MEKEIRVLMPEDFSELKEIEKHTPDYFGFVYFLEYGDSIKIGKSQRIYERLMNLKRQGEKYADKKVGRVVITPMCTNYSENEKVFHKLFDEKRRQGTELFDIKLIDAVETALDPTISYLDESKEIAEKESRLFDGFIKFCKGGYRT